MTFGKRSEFIFAAMTDIDSFFIRRKKWIDILYEYKSSGDLMKAKIVEEYVLTLKYRIQRLKKKDIKNFMSRYDYDSI